VLQVVPLGGPAAPTVAVVDRLARLQLELSRSGRGMVLTDVCGDLERLLELTGLSRLRGKVQREAEGLEDPFRLQE
jgi:hypothetical protein